MWSGKRAVTVISGQQETKYRARPGNGVISVTPAFTQPFYSMVCSKASNSAVEKNPPSVIPSPSHSILIVRILGFWLFPYKMFFSDDGGIADRLANLLIVMFLCSHKINMRFLTAVIVSMKFTSLFCFILLIVAGLCRLRVLLYRLPVAYCLLILWMYTHITKKMEERLCIVEIVELM